MAAFYAGSITSNPKFTTKVYLLMKATSNDEKPTQGYDLQEISKISKSSLSNCQSLLTFLLGRLEKKDPRIKFKVLHLMKYLVINGSSEFKSQLSHNAEAVKQTVNFKGELDPLHGDGLNIKVQQTALELEKLLFDVNNPEIEIISKAMLAPDQSGKKMQGFGFTRAPEIRKETSLMDTLMKVKKTGSEMFSVNKSKPKFPSNEYKPTSLTPQPQYTPVDMDDSAIQPSSESGFADEEENDEIDEIESEIDSDYFYERKLVQSITAEGGITRIPSKEMLKDFVNKSSSLELPAILNLLDQRLQHPSLNVQLKSLCVIEYLLRSSLENIPSEINEHCSSVHLLAESQDQNVQAKAKKIVLAVASCLKREENNTGVSRAQALVPPCYNEAKELPNIKADDCRDKLSEPKTAKNAEFDSLFSGMNLSTQKSSPVSSKEISSEKCVETELDSCATKTETRHDFGGNCKLMEVNESLIDIENTANNVSPENSDLLAMLDTNNCNSKQNSSGVDKQRTSKSNEDTFEPLSNPQSRSNDLDLISLEPLRTGTSEHSTFQNTDLHFLETNELESNVPSRESGEKIVQDPTICGCYAEDQLKTFQPSKANCDTPQQHLDISLLQETDKRRVILNSKEAPGVNSGRNEPTAFYGDLNSKNVDLLNWQFSNTDSNDYRASSTQNTENLLLLSPEQHNQSSPKILSQQPRHINPQGTVQTPLHDPNSDLLSFPPPPRHQMLPGGLVLPNNSSSRPRRPFPKDMKSEVVGFDFIRNSSKSDAFSFIRDEIQATKSKPK